MIAIRLTPVAGLCSRVTSFGNRDRWTRIERLMGFSRSATRSRHSSHRGWSFPATAFMEFLFSRRIQRGAAFGVHRPSDQKIVTITSASKPPVRFSRKRPLKMVLLTTLSANRHWLLWPAAVLAFAKPRVSFVTRHRPFSNAGFESPERLLLADYNPTSRSPWRLCNGRSRANSSLSRANIAAERDRRTPPVLASVGGSVIRMRRSPRSFTAERLQDAAPHTQRRAPDRAHRHLDGRRARCGAGKRRRTIRDRARAARRPFRTTLHF